MPEGEGSRIKCREVVQEVVLQGVGGTGKTEGGWRQVCRHGQVGHTACAEAPQGVGSLLSVASHASRLSECRSVP